MKARMHARGIALTAVLVLALALALVMVGFRDSDADYFLNINKSIDIFGRVYREVAINYVDDIDPEKFMEAGIDGLLGTLDPYTNFISEKEGDEVELITSGKYGGIGVTIGLRDGYITIISLMEGYSAQRQGLQPGDRIVEIEGKSITGLKPENVRSMTRGEPGTEVHLRVERDGEPRPLEFVLVREEIQVKNVTYADFIRDGIAYIRLERFSRTAGDELELAIKDLKLKGAIKGMILDLRNNPGGLLDAAVDVVEKFVPKGSLVVSTRGRRPETERKYFAGEEPMLPDVPLVVLVNRGSASASEIVTGAIQDLDRGVIMGTRTFGKGLVQTITPLAYGTQLKITTAKYYTPSGRCIQEIDYSQKNSEGVFGPTPDSLKRKFKTLNGRSELEAGGIQPDSVVPDVNHSDFFTELLRKSMFFKYATRYAVAHKDLPSSFRVDDAMLDDFQQFLKDQKFTYQDAGEIKLAELGDIAAKSKYGPSIINEIGHLKEQLAEEKSTSVRHNSTEVSDALRTEIVSRYHGERGRIESSLEDDGQVTAAVALLENAKAYRQSLKGD